jgi:hypothetical protein
MTTHKSKHMYLKCGPRTVGRDFIGFEFLITEGLSKGPFFKKVFEFLITEGLSKGPFFKKSVRIPNYGRSFERTFFQKKYIVFGKNSYISHRISISRRN